MGTFDKAKDALKSELITDAVLDKAAAAAKTKLGQDKASQVDMARDFIALGVRGVRACGHHADVRRGGIHDRDCGCWGRCRPHACGRGHGDGCACDYG